ncbi:MAG: flagellar protein FliT [Lachnospiraceae bacterium]|jgi:DNA-binding protein H-NS|nr:flagellar protein FliT [Lachnospiraceae bacterium]
MEENYITILIQSLEKKIKVLEEVSRENANQKQILREDDMDMDAFQASIDKKDRLIEQVGFLDDGFEKMYERVKQVLNEKSDVYAEQIAHLKQLIMSVTDWTASIQKEEWDNRRLAEQQFSSMKKKVRQMKDSKQVATKYYQSMAKLNYVDPQFMDKKK